MPLLTLPTEVLHLIARNLDTSQDILSLVLICTRSYGIFLFSLDEFNAIYQGSSALIWAAGNGQKDLAKRLLRHPRILANPTDAVGRTPLFHAIAAKDLDMVRLLVSDSRVAISWRDHRQTSPVSVAAACGMESAIRILVGLGADINSCDRKGDTPLHCAAKHRQESPIRQLFQYHNLDSTATNKNGATAYHVAMLTFHDSITKLFIDHLAGSGKESSSPYTFAPLKKVRDW
jgi:ankyrin repeat protein